MGETGEKRCIILNEIDHKKSRFRETIGLTYIEETQEGQRIINSCNSQEAVAVKLGLTLEEVTRALKTGKKQYSELVVHIWREKNREVITLEEAIGTQILLKSLLGRSVGLKTGFGSN